MPLTTSCPGCSVSFTHRADRKNPYCSHKCAAKTNNKLGRSRPKGRNKALCHPDRWLVSGGLCQSCWAREYYKENRDTLRQISRKTRLKKFGLTPDQWYKMYFRQGAKCPICLVPIYRTFDPSKTAAIDHDPLTGRIRGLLCSTCNTSRVGANTLDTIQRVTNYLEADFDGRKL